MRQLRDDKAERHQHIILQTNLKHRQFLSKRELLQICVSQNHGNTQNQQAEQCDCKNDCQYGVAARPCCDCCVTPFQQKEESCPCPADSDIRLLRSFGIRFRLVHNLIGSEWYFRHKSYILISDDSMTSWPSPFSRWKLRKF